MIYNDVSHEYVFDLNMHRYIVENGRKPEEMDITSDEFAHMIMTGQPLEVVENMDYYRSGVKLNVIIVTAEL